jgi:hypothetical protein
MVLVFMCHHCLALERLSGKSLQAVKQEKARCSLSKWCGVVGRFTAGGASEGTEPKGRRTVKVIEVE